MNYNETERGLAIMQLNSKRLATCKKYENYNVSAVVAAANRTGCKSSVNQINSSITFHIFKELDIEVARDEKRELFDYFDNKIREIYARLDKIKIV